jgi:hypothetical protein
MHGRLGVGRGYTVNLQKALGAVLYLQVLGAYYHSGCSPVSKPSHRASLSIAVFLYVFGKGRRLAERSGGQTIPAPTRCGVCGVVQFVVGDRQNFKDLDLSVQD